MPDPFARFVRRRTLVAIVAVAVLGLGFGAPVHGEDAAVPGSCKAHPKKVVKPGCVPALTESATEPAWTLPNLVPNVRDVSIGSLLVLDPETQTFVPGPLQLMFDTHAQNLGTVPLEIMIDEVPTEETVPVTQCVSWTAGRLCRERQPVGGLEYHEPHSHFHFNNFASYELRRLGGDGRPDYSDAGLVAMSEKVSFCLIDSEPVREDAFPARTYIDCGRLMQGVSAGWTDIYGGDLPGQQFPRDNLADGRYALIVRMDYANHLYESDETDNVLEATVELSEGVTQASVVDRHYP